MVNHVMAEAENAILKRIDEILEDLILYLADQLLEEVEEIDVNE